MEDTALTIEYLRARLLSERSISKCAKRRADELAYRVMELEEQLKVITRQRMKATSDVIAILESLGISDSYEESGSESVEDLNCLDMNTDKSRSTDKEVLEPPTLSCRSLSWKSRKCYSQCNREFVNTPSRWRNSYPSTNFSSHKHRIGKSCRQVRRRVMRCTIDECSKNESKSDSQIATEDSKLSGYNHERDEELITSEHHFENREGDKGIQRALERQAELIYKHEAEENAQMEWEEKLKQNNSSTPESIEPGSDITEERDELKRHPSCSQPQNEIVNSGVKDARTNEACRVLTNESDIRPSPETTVVTQTYQNIDREVYNQTCHSHIDAFMNEKRQTQDNPEDYSVCPPSSVMHQPLISYDSSSLCQTVGINANYCEGETSKSTPRKPTSVPNEASDELGAVLVALQQAKFSLRQKLEKLSLPKDTFMEKTVEPHHVPSMSSARAQMPTSRAALLKVPTDVQAEGDVHKHKKYLDSKSHSSLMDRYCHSASAVLENFQFELKPEKRITMSSVSDGSSFDFTPILNTAQSCLDSRDEYARTSALYEKCFSDRFKFSPQIGTPRSACSDELIQSPYPDYNFSFLTSDFFSSSPQHENYRSNVYEDDPLAQGAFANRLSPIGDEQNFKTQGEATSTISSHISHNQFARDPYSSPD